MLEKTMRVEDESAAAALPFFEGLAEESVKIYSAVHISSVFPLMLS
jgi:hypothetical protein